MREWMKKLASWLHVSEDELVAGLARLTSGERRVLELRYSGWTLQETAERLIRENNYPGVKLTKERVRQIEVRALDKLRKACAHEQP